MNLTKPIGILCLCIVTAGWGDASASPGGPDDRVTEQPNESRANATATDGTPANEKPAGGDAKLASGRRKASRSFQFHYRFTVTGLEPGEKVRTWLPVPTSSSHQRVDPLLYQLPAKPTFHREPQYGNQILFVETTVPPGGQLHFDLPYQIERQEVVGIASDGGRSEIQELSSSQRKRFQRPNANVPVRGKPLELLGGLDLSEDPLTLANQLYEVVDQHVTYKKVGSGWGEGDVLWVCDSRYGNCTDFHSLFISLARSQGVPSRFEIGFPISGDKKQGPVGGYHCWAFFYTPQQGWVPVDISEADKHPSMKAYYFGNLTRDRVTFSVGRDIELVPKCESGPLNYFIYPHVEVGGAAVGREQIELNFTFTEIDSPRGASHGDGR